MSGDDAVAGALVVAVGVSLVAGLGAAAVLNGGGIVRAFVDKGVTPRRRLAKAIVPSLIAATCAMLLMPSFLAVRVFLGLVAALSLETLLAQLTLQDRYFSLFATRRLGSGDLTPEQMRVLGLIAVALAVTSGIATWIIRDFGPRNLTWGVLPVAAVWGLTLWLILRKPKPQA